MFFGGAVTIQERLLLACVRYLKGSCIQKICILLGAYSVSRTVIVYGQADVFCSMGQFFRHNLPKPVGIPTVNETVT